MPMTHSQMILMMVLLQILMATASQMHTIPIMKTEMAMEKAALKVAAKEKMDRAKDKDRAKAKDRDKVKERVKPRRKARPVRLVLVAARPRVVRRSKTNRVPSAA